VALLAAPENDAVGLTLEAARLGSRARRPAAMDDDF
jgi:hypothetical protein